MLKFQENVNELLKPKPAPSLKVRNARKNKSEARRGLLVFYHSRRGENSIIIISSTVACLCSLESDRKYFSFLYDFYQAIPRDLEQVKIGKHDTVSI